MTLRNLFCMGDMSYICKPAFSRNYHFLQNPIKYSIFRNESLILKNKNTRGFRRSKQEDPFKKNTFTEVETPFQGVKISTGPVYIGRLWKPLGFTIAFCTASIGGTAIWQYENLRRNAGPSNPVEWFQNRLQQHNRKYSSWRRDFNHWWNSLTEGERLFVPICFLNVLVFCMWRSPRLQPFMVKYFCSNPASRAVCWPMVLSTFSHYSLFHLMANMYVLHSFSTGAVAALGKEEFLALYLSAGVISSMFSYVLKVTTGQIGLSLGASGAIMGVIGFVCAQYPDTTLSIIFMPWIQFSAGAAIKAIMGFDLAGVILGWKFFDHAAHLGGAAAGIFWCYFGHTYIWQKREPLIRYWHKLRVSNSSGK